MPKFKKLEKELTSNIEKWMYFLKNLSKLNEIPEKLRTEMFIKAFKIAEIANFTEEQKLAYDQSVKYYRDLKNVIDKSYDDGRKENSIETAKRK